MIPQMLQVMDCGCPLILPFPSAKLAGSMVTTQDHLPFPFPSGRVIESIPSTIGCGRHLPYPFTCCYLFLIHPYPPHNKRDKGCLPCLFSQLIIYHIINMTFYDRIFWVNSCSAYPCRRKMWRISMCIVTAICSNVSLSTYRISRIRMYLSSVSW